MTEGKRHSVRIIGGRWRGRRVAIPELPGLRPTPDRVRETLFNWLQFEIAQTRCLDLFAGSGALGFEALSRGAAGVLFVEQSERAAQHLQRYIRQFDATGSARLACAEAIGYLQGASEAFDVVFLDPPFGAGLVAAALPLLAHGSWVRPAGYVYVESERTAGAPGLPQGFALTKSKYAGEVGYHLLRRGV